MSQTKYEKLKEILAYVDSISNVDWCRSNQGVYEVRSYLPRRCFETKQWLWFKKCYQIHSLIVLPGQMFVSWRYFTKEAYLKLKLLQ